MIKRVGTAILLASVAMAGASAAATVECKYSGVRYTVIVHGEGRSGVCAVQCVYNYSEGGPGHTMSTVQVEPGEHKIIADNQAPSKITGAENKSICK